MNDPERAAPLPRRFASLLRVALAITVIGALLHWVGVAEVLARISACPPQAVVGSFVAALLGQWLGALRFHQLATGRRLPLSRLQALGINLSTVFYGLLLPGGTATSWLVRLLRWRDAQQRLGLALTVIAGDRALATIAGALIGVVADLTLHSPGSLAVTVAFSMVALVAGAVGWSLLNGSGSLRVAGLPGFGWPEGIVVQGSQAEVGNPQLTLQAAGSAAALSFGVHGLGIVAWWILARALGLQLGLTEIAWVRSAALVAGLLPVTVGGLGLREGTVVALLAVFGLSSADALSLSLLAFTVTVLGVGVVGGFGEAARLVRRK